MNISKLSILSGVLLIILAGSGCLGGPPTAASSAADPWYNPARWQMPSMPWSGEQPRIRKKSQGMVTDMNQSAKRGWAKTKSALNPSRMFVSDPKPNLPKSAPGFWESLFGPARDSQDVHTVNDFLSQPHPR